MGYISLNRKILSLGKIKGNKISCNVPEMEYFKICIENCKWGMVSGMPFLTPCISGQEFFAAKQKNSNNLFFPQFSHRFNSKTSEILKIRFSFG